METRKYANFELIPKPLLCTLCKDVLIQPVIADCGHSFCKDCILSYISTNKDRGTSECPICKMKIRESKLISHVLAKDIIGDIEVFCIQCNWKGSLKLLLEHKNKCIKKSGDKNSVIPKWLTDYMDNKKELRQHSAERKSEVDSGQNLFDRVAKSKGGSLIKNLERLFKKKSGLLEALDVN